MQCGIVSHALRSEATVISLDLEIMQLDETDNPQDGAGPARLEVNIG